MAQTADPIAHIGRYVERHLERIRAPGTAVGLTDRERLLGVVTHGLANPRRERRSGPSICSRSPRSASRSPRLLFFNNTRPAGWT